MTRKRKQKQERAEANVETAVISELALTEGSLVRSSPTAQAIKGEPEADTSPMDAACTTPSTIGNEESYDVAITISDKSCSMSESVSAASSETPIRGLSPDLTYPPSDNMDVDVDISVTGAVQNPTCEIPGALEPSTSRPSSGIPVDQFYGSMPNLGGVKPDVIVDNEDSGEDQQQEAEVDDMLAVTQSSSGDLPPQYVAL